MTNDQRPPSGFRRTYPCDNVGQGVKFVAEGAERKDTGAGETRGEKVNKMSQSKTSPCPRCDKDGFYRACAYYSYGQMFQEVRFGQTRLG